MNAMTGAETRPEMFSPELGADLSVLISRLAVKLASNWELKEDLLEKAEELAFTLIIASKNPILISDEAVRLTQDNLSWMENYLDGKLTDFILTSEQNERLEKVYTTISRALSEILFQNAEIGQAQA